MRKSIFYTFLVSILLLSFSCSKKNASNSKNNLLDGKVILTGATAKIEINPTDENFKNENRDVIFERNVSEVSFTLPNYTYYINLYVVPPRDEKKKFNGYLEINGKKKNFTVTNEGFKETYLLCEFK